MIEYVHIEEYFMKYIHSIHIISYFLFYHHFSYFIILANICFILELCNPWLILGSTGYCFDHCWRGSQAGSNIAFFFETIARVRAIVES